MDWAGSEDAPLSEWGACVDAALEQALARVPRSPFVVARGDERATQTAIVDWTGLPLRIVTALGRKRALAVLDCRGSADNELWHLQEEYLEWRVEHDEDGVIRRVELTCELPEYWGVLAANDPVAALRIAAAFSDAQQVSAASLFGVLDPLADEVGPAEREAAFAATVLEGAPRSFGNDQVLCCMVHPSNTLEAVAGLVAAAAFAFVGECTDGSARLGARSIIPALAGAAVVGRGSDPLVVERLVRLAGEGRLVTVDHPAALAIVGVEHARLRRPDGRAAPAAWWRLQRPAGPRRFRRVTLEVPVTAGLRVGDLVDGATEERIAHGGQVADLVQVAMCLRVSASGVLDVERRVCERVELNADDADADVRQAWEAFTRKVKAQ